LAGITPELWDPETGARRVLPEFTDGDGTVVVPLKFAPHESYFVVFPKGSLLEAESDRNFPVQSPVMSIDKAWVVNFDPIRGGPGKAVFPTLQDWRASPDRGIKYYSGIATYTTSFDLPDGADLDGQYLIDVGEVYEMASVSLNGVELGIVWTAPWQLPVGDALKASGNVLTVDVANSWENRLIGDQTDVDKDARTLQWDSGLLEGNEYKTGRHTFTTYDNPATDFELQPSGLIGPVQLVEEKG
jgi:hypothetical protein